MNYAWINPTDIANGVGVRVSLFVSGCRRHCPGCHNQQAWDFIYGEPYTDEAADYILECLEKEYIDGISILGGEPMELENVDVVCSIVSMVRELYPDKSIWVYTGYKYEELLDGIHGYLLSKIDVLVDGPYIEAERDITLKFRGSRNQRIIDVQKSLKIGGVVLYEL
jgi:anaerobic ribonucleoside-triphosphate reductase activating protein